MTALATALAAASRAADDAALAQRKAQAAQERAEAAAAAAAVEQASRRHRWAEGVADSFNDDVQADGRALTAAKSAFQDAAINDLPACPGRYLLWVEAAIRARLRFEVFANAASTLQLKEWNGAALPSASTPVPPSFSAALDAAMAAAFTETAAGLRDEMDGAILALLAGEGSD